MVFAPLRDDDAMHVKPKELLMSEEGLFSVAWQTEINRKRRGTKVRGPSREVQSFRLARGGLEAPPARGSRQGPRVRDLNTRDEFRASPASYQRSLQWLKFFAEYSLNQYFQNQELLLKELISGLGSDYPLCSRHLARRSSSCRKINGGDRLTGKLEEPWSTGAQIHQKQDQCPSSDGPGCGLRRRVVLRQVTGLPDLP